MSISFQCPHCNRSYTVKDEWAGKKASCKQCKKVMMVPSATSATASIDSHALEALATAALTNGSAERTPIPESLATIKMECEYCFEAVEFPLELSGKKSPCPSCRRIIQVPKHAGQAQKDWRAVESTLTMARKSTQPAPEGAWGNAQLQQQIVSREALLEAEVLVDRKTLAARDWTKWYIAGAIVALMGAIGGWMYFGAKAKDDRRIGLMADAIKAVPSLPPDWSPGIHIAAGEFFLREEKPEQFKSAVNQLQEARTAIRKAESPTDKANLLIALVEVQAGLAGDDARIAAGLALPSDELQRELRRSVQIVKELPREDGWLIIEALAKSLGGVGVKQPMLITLAPEALPAETDRADALATAAMALQAKGDATAEVVAKKAQEMQSAGEASPRLIAMLIARGQLPQARQLLPEPTGDEPPLAARLAYAEGLARTGDPANLERARQIASAKGQIEHQVSAWAMLVSAAFDAGHKNEVERAVEFILKEGGKRALPPWAMTRLGYVCRRAGRGDLALKLAGEANAPPTKPWLELDGLLAELSASTSAGDPSRVDQMEKTPAQGFAWMSLARHNTRHSRGDARSIVAGWPNEHSQTAGFAASYALGLQDRAR